MEYIKLVLEDLKPVAGFKDEIVLEVRKKGKRSIVFHPILGGKNVAANAFAKFFGWFGWTTIIQHKARRPHEYNDLSEINEGVNNMLYNNQQAWDFLVNKNIITPDKTMVMGASYGGINTAIASSQLPAAGFITIVAGADVPEIFNTSEERAIKRWREAQQPDQWQRFITEPITDPINLCANREGKGVLMFNALFDKSVPTKNQAKLRDAYKSRPMTTWWPSGHESIVYWLPFILPMALLYAFWRTR